MDIRALLSELVEVEYIAIRVELYIKPIDDIKSKLLSGLILDHNLMYAYKEKIKGLVKYQDVLAKASSHIPTEYVIKINDFVQKNIDNINLIINGLDNSIDIDVLTSYIKSDQEMYAKLIFNNNIIMNNLADKYLKGDLNSEEILETNQIIEESNNNKDNIEYNLNEIKTVYTPHENIDNSNMRNRYLFQISEIEKAITEIEGKGEKSRKDINELYLYHNEILKIRAALSRL